MILKSKEYVIGELERAIEIIKAIDSENIYYSCGSLGPKPIKEEYYFLIDEIQERIDFIQNTDWVEK